MLCNTWCSETTRSKADRVMIIKTIMMMMMMMMVMMSMMITSYQ